MYSKQYPQMLESSIAEDWQVRHVFMDLLMLADPYGVVDKTPEYIARATNVPLEIVKRGIEVLSSPDPRSRNPAHEGRRLIRLDEHRDWGWQIVNFLEYRSMRDEDAKREYMRKYQAEHRKVGAGKPKLAHTEGEAKAKTEVEVPPELNDLALYEADRKFCARLPEVRDSWKAAYPGVNIAAEIAKAHAWEMANPDKRKVNRIKFMTNWLNRAQDNPRPARPPAGSEAARHTAASERTRDRDKLNARRNEPPPPPHPAMLRLREMLKAGVKELTTDTGQRWEVGNIGATGFQCYATVDGLRVTKPVDWDRVEQFREFQTAANAAKEE